MAKRVKIQVDVNDVFLDTVDPAVRTAVVKSEMWPIVLAAYATTERKAKVGAFHNAGEKIIHMMTDEGFSVCGIAKTITGEEYSFMSADNHLVGVDPTNTYHYSNRMSSANPRYMASNLRPESKHDAKASLMSDLRKAQVAPSDIFRQTLHMMIENFAGGWSGMGKPEVSVDRELITELVLAQFSEDKYEIPPAQAQRLRGVYLDHMGEVRKFNAMLDRAAAYFTTDKWLLIPNSLGGVILGAVSYHAIQVAIDTYRKTGNLPMETEFNYGVPVVPFKRYKSMNDIPADIASELNIALTMLKAHTNTQEGMPNVAEPRYWESIEAIGLQHYRIGRTPLYILSK